MVTSNYTKVLYFSSKSRTPDIVRPFNDNHWQVSRNVEFTWIYNGFDLQFEYELEIYAFDSNEYDIPDEWFNNIEDGSDDVSVALGTALGGGPLSPAVTRNEITTYQTKFINLASISPFDTEDGSYLWRIRTKGNIASEWSDWNPSGRVLLDSVAPIIRNACIETPVFESDSGQPGLASHISDLSSPFIFSERIAGMSTVTDRHIDRAGSAGLYVSYDYRDNSIVLRAQKGGATTDPRFYGLISFHGTENNLVPDFSVQSAIKSAYLYTINKDSVDGPFEQTRYSDHLAGSFVGDTLEKIIYKENSGSTANDAIPKGFPKFLTGSVYNSASDHENHPAGFDRTISFFSSFPFSTRTVTRTLTFPLAGPTGISQTQTFTNAIELRYPIPYNDLFILFEDSSMGTIVAYGQYDSADIDRTLDETDTGNFNLVRGLDVKSWRDSGETLPNPLSTAQYQFFSSISPTTDIQVNPNLRGFSSDVSNDQIANGQIRSHYLFFNLTADDTNDNALKIFLRPEALSLSDDPDNIRIDQIDPDDDTLPRQISFIDFKMSPETDCAFQGVTPGEQTTNIGEVFIGKAKISPKGLSYNEITPSQKQILVDPRVAPVPFRNEGDLSGQNDLVTLVKNWGCDNSVLTFSQDPDQFNGSFRLKIPLFKYVPYYHPGAVNLSETPTNTQPPIPHIYDADPEKDGNNVIGWDTLTLETKEDASVAREALVQSDLIFKGDFVRFMGTARPLGQINPFLYNFERWATAGVPEGTIMRVRDDGPFQPFTLKPDDYLFYGSSMFEDGWFYDGTHFNNIDRGFYSVGDVTRNLTTSTSQIHLINFASFLFRRSVEFANKSVFLASDEYTEDIFAVDDGTNTTLIDDSVLSAAGTGNGPSFIYRITVDSNFQNALITGDDISTQGHFGRGGEIDQAWLEDDSNSYGGYYLIETDSNTDTATQIKRIISISGTSFNYTLMSPLDRFDISTAPTGGRTLTGSGDAFSLGNIFGYIMPTTGNKVKIFMDIEEADAGIDRIKVYQTDIETAPINFGETNPNVIDSSQYIGPIDDSGNDTKIGVLMQKINNRVFDLSDQTSTNNALQLIKTTRSPVSLMTHQFNSVIQLFEDAETATRTCIDTRTGVEVETEVNYTSDEPGYFHEIAITGTGLKIIYIQVKDRSGNVSNIYPIPVFVPASSTAEPLAEIQSATTTVDDGQVVRDITTATVSGENLEFEEHLLPIDTDKSRAITIKKLIIEDTDNPGEYKPVDNVNDLLAGFSDNYGLSFNVYSPLSSINTWRFTRPFSIRMKSMDENTRADEPMWYFDPNHVRHYKTNTDEEFASIIDENAVQANNSLSNVTLLGFSLSDDEADTNDRNPIAEILLNFREEFIGKTLRLGSIMDQSFTIVHIFKRPLSSVSKIFGQTTETIDEDNSDKVWVVVDDPDAICALVASRKSQYATQTGDNFNTIRLNTFREDSSQFGGSTLGEDLTSFFGYEPNESDLDGAISDLVNQALKMNGDMTDGNGTIINTPGNSGSFSEGELSIFFIPNSIISSSSGITTDEGWTTQVFQAFEHQNDGSLINPPTGGKTTLDNLTNRQFMGLAVYDKLVFGQDITLTADILSTSVFDSGLGGTVLFLDGDPFDETMVSLTYEIRNKTTNTILDIEGAGFNPIIDRVEKGGQVVVVEDNITSLLSFGSNNYELRLTLEGLDSKDPVTETDLDDGWWPSVDSIRVPPLGNRVGTVGTSNQSARKDVDFAIISNGAFYIPESGEYTFEMVIDDSPKTYADFTIDYFRNRDGGDVSGDIQDLVETTGINMYVSDAVGGFFNTNTASPYEKTFYLTKGWHIGRLRYIASDPSNTNFLRVLYSKANWGDETLRAPMIGDNSSQYTFLARAYRSVFCKIRDQQFEQKFPTTGNDATLASQFCRTVLGFIRELTDVGSNTTVNQVALIERDDGADFGDRISTTLPEGGPTFGGQLFEEVFAVYLSNIFDAGPDFRFWRTISWSPDPGSQPSGTTVQFEVRTGSTEQELLSNKFNTIEESGEEITFDPFTTPGANILKFSFTGSGSDPDSIKINRFIQFRMTLKSRERDVTPVVDDVTIVFSKENTVNFFTTTFNLESNILRAILTYNGEEPVDTSGVALTEIQFGLSTTEVTDGVVSTNFSDYQIIPVNEAFSLSQLGIPEGSNFRIGIRLVASSEEVPTVDEFALMFETAGDPEKLNQGL